MLAVRRLQEAEARAVALLEQLQASEAAHAEALAEAEQVRLVMSTHAARNGQSAASTVEEGEG